MSRQRATALAMLVALSMIGALGPVHAQTFPDKPLRIIVPWAPGGSTDTIGRTLAARLSQTIGQQVVVENKPGAGGIIGAELGAKATPDGYTLTIVELPHATAQALMTKVPYDLNTDFAPVAYIGASPLILFANANVKANNLKEVVALSREKAGIAFATSGTGSISHLVGELLQKQANAQFVFVPYKGSSPALLDLGAGEVQAFFATLASGVGALKTGRVKAIGLTSAKRVLALPDVPTVGESGFNDLIVEQWWGIVAPAKTPAPILEKLRNEVAAAIAHSAMKERMVALAIEPGTMSPEQFRTFMSDEARRWGKVAKDANIRLEQ